MPVLYHFSHDGHITRFVPRPAPSRSFDNTHGDMVWAVAADKQYHFLFPRDCPRVTFYIGANTSDEDKVCFFGLTTARRVVAIESAWLPALLSAELYRYEFAPGTHWICLDEGADYWISRQPETPANVTRIDDVCAALLTEDVELRVTPSLWPLADAVAASTMEFSNIRMRNAAPR